MQMLLSLMIEPNVPYIDIWINYDVVDIRKFESNSASKHNSLWWTWRSGIRKLSYPLTKQRFYCELVYCTDCTNTSLAYCCTVGSTYETCIFNCSGQYKWQSSLETGQISWSSYRLVIISGHALLLWTDGNELLVGRIMLSLQFLRLLTRLWPNN